ncbi:MAG: hypothetical protein Q9208_004144 [Pyrenodesmia sp. 3 TL-2023]
MASHRVHVKERRGRIDKQHLPLDAVTFGGETLVNGEARPALDKQDRKADTFGKMLAEPHYGKDSECFWPCDQLAPRCFKIVGEAQRTVMRDDVVCSVADIRAIRADVATGNSVKDETRILLAQKLFQLAEYLEGLKHSLEQLRSEEENGLAKTVDQLARAYSHPAFQKWQTIMNAALGKEKDSQWRPGFLQANFERAREEDPALLETSGKSDFGMSGRQEIP